MHEPVVGLQVRSNSPLAGGKLLLWQFVESLFKNLNKRVFGRRIGRNVDQYGTVVRKVDNIILPRPVVVLLQVGESVGIQCGDCSPLPSRT